MTKATTDRKFSKIPISLKDEEVDKAQGGAGASGGPTPQVKTVDKTEQGFLSRGGFDNHSD